MPHPSFSSSLAELQSVLNACGDLSTTVETSGKAILDSLHNGGKVMSCGNGGSAADAMHLVEELVGRFRSNRRPLPAVCLNADPTILTCIGNDFGYDTIFARPIEALGRPGDVLVAFTTSGNSPNVLAAIDAAKPLGITRILVSGRDGGLARGRCDHEIIIPSINTARIQEVHTLVLHQWLEMIEASFPPSVNT